MLSTGEKLGPPAKSGLAPPRTPGIPLPQACQMRRGGEGDLWGGTLDRGPPGQGPHAKNPAMSRLTAGHCVIEAMA